MQMEPPEWRQMDKPDKWRGRMFLLCIGLITSVLCDAGVESKFKFKEGAVRNGQFGSRKIRRAGGGFKPPFGYHNLSESLSQ